MAKSPDSRYPGIKRVFGLLFFAAPIGYRLDIQRIFTLGVSVKSLLLAITAMTLATPAYAGEASSVAYD
ncbi:MAG: hypothetical protein WAU86_01075, partial [Oricola sp.]